jgi:hypothetical protein
MIGIAEKILRIRLKRKIESPPQRLGRDFSPPLGWQENKIISHVCENERMA